MKTLGIPIPTLRRLPLYYQQLLKAEKNDQEYISSLELGIASGSTPEQVRKDLSYLTGQGKSRVGYNTKKLTSIIEDHLGLMVKKDAVLVGAGNLGKALSLYKGFAQYGFKIVALFENDPNKIGSQVGDLPIISIEKLIDVVSQLKVRIGVITTPPPPAQEIADMMVAGGIKAIWNFSTVPLTAPENVLVRNVDLSLELAVISHFIIRTSIQSE